MFGKAEQTVAKKAATIAEAKEYRKAFTTLGAMVKIEAWGVWENEDGRLAFLSSRGAGIVTLLNTYVEAIVDGELVRMKMDRDARIVVRGTFTP